MKGNIKSGNVTTREQGIIVLIDLTQRLFSWNIPSHDNYFVRTKWLKLLQHKTKLNKKLRFDGAFDNENKKCYFKYYDKIWELNEILLFEIIRRKKKGGKG